MLCIAIAIAIAIALGATRSTSSGETRPQARPTKTRCLRPLLPRSMGDQRIHFVVDGPQLCMYLKSIQRRCGEHFCDQQWRSDVDAEHLFQERKDDGPPAGRIRQTSFDSSGGRTLNAGWGHRRVFRFWRADAAGRQIQLEPQYDNSTRPVLLGTHYVAAPDAAGQGLISAADLARGIEVNGHSLGGYLATAFARLLGSYAHVQQVSTFNSAGFAPEMVLSGGASWRA